MCEANRDRMTDQTNDIELSGINPLRKVEDSTRWIVQAAVIINGQHSETRLVIGQNDRALVIDGFNRAKEVATRLTAATQPADGSLVRFVYYAVPAGVLFETEAESVQQKVKRRRRRSTEISVRLEDL
jgi:hypothetical protein